MRTRILLATCGVALAAFGAFRLLTEIGFSDLIILALWLVAAVAIHDGILSPLVVSAGWAISRFVPARGRRYLQFGLVVAALVTVIAVPLILREDTQPGSKAILNQAYGGNLTILLGLIAACTLIAYAIRVARHDKVPLPAGASANQEQSP